LIVASGFEQFSTPGTPLSLALDWVPVPVDPLPEVPVEPVPLDPLDPALPVEPVLPVVPVEPAAFDPVPPVDPVVAVPPVAAAGPVDPVDPVVPLAPATGAEVATLPGAGRRAASRALCDCRLPHAVSPRVVTNAALSSAVRRERRSIDRHLIHET
jgi:hypothetical protein